MTTVNLKTEDNEVFKVPAKVARMSLLLKTMLEELGSENDEEVIHLPNINSEIMRLVIQWATYHEQRYEEYCHPTTNIDLWDVQFLRPLRTDTLCQLMNASHYLNMKGLLNSVAETIANMIRGKSVEEIRQAFNIRFDEPDNNSPAEIDSNEGPAEDNSDAPAEIGDCKGNAESDVKPVIGIKVDPAEINSDKGSSIDNKEGPAVIDDDVPNDDK